jgi:DnaJ family protein C protein 28
MVRNIEEHIRRAMEAGHFADLPGKGKPLNLEENAYEDPTWRLARHLLHSNGFTLPWIETRREIEQDLAGARSGLARSWSWRRQALTEDVSLAFIEGEWQQAVKIFEATLAELNQRIASYNLSVPSDLFYLPRLNLAGELEAVQAG